MAFLLSTDEYDVYIRLIAFAANLLKYSLEHSFPYLTMSDSDVPGQDSADEASVQERSSDHEREGTARLGLLDRHDDGVDDEVEDSDEEDQDNAGGDTPGRVAPDPWLAHLQELRLPSHSIAYQLSQEYADVEWEEALEPFRAWARVTADPNYNADQAVYSFADSPATSYFLVVKEGKVEVMFGLRRCHPLRAGGLALAGLIGERQWRAGTFVHPQMYKLAPQPDQQGNVFRPVKKRAMPASVMQEYFKDDETRLVTQQLNEPAEQVVGWRALPIHPKLAVPFFQGVAVRDAFLLTSTVIDMMPEELRHHAAIWYSSMRVAAVAKSSTGSGVNTSALSKTWERVDHFSRPQITEWYYSLVNTSAKVPAPPASSAVGPTGRGSRATSSTSSPPASSAVGPPGRDETSPTSAAGFPPGAAEFFENLTDRLTQPAPATKSSKRYEWHEMVYLFERAGLPKGTGESPYSGLAQESLPHFFRELESLRGDKANARSFIESYRTTHYPRSKTQYQFILTSQMIKDLKQLSLAGDDPQCLFDNRHRGLSVFSLAPLSESSMDGKAREQMITYELTMDNHGPAEAAAMAKLSALAQSVPSTRQESYSWVEHVDIMTRMFLGDRCRANKYHSQLLDVLTLVADFTYWKPDDWKAFIWVWHRALRALLNRGTSQPFRMLVSTLQAGGKVDKSNLPPQMRSQSGGGGGGSGTPGTPKRKADDDKGPPKKKAGSKTSQHFAAALASARGKTKTVLRAGTVMPDEETTRSILGAEFYSLVPQGQDPCVRHFIFGKCSSCPRAHTLSKAPSQPLLDGVLQRLQKRLDTIVKENPK